ncbi:DNA primase large subunit PriL [archaeon MnTg01]|nr:DNA primase large subunit PriL [archaeon MnTg01]
MTDLGQDEMSKYPFLADAGQYLKDQGFTLDQFGSDPDLQLFLDKAIHRIKSAANGILYKSDIKDNETSSDATLPIEVFSFLLAVILLKLNGNNTLIRKFSLAEARRAEDYLKKDLKEMSDKVELAKKIIYSLSSITVENADKKNEFFIPVYDYLKHSVHFHEKEWKLINRHVEDGKVFLNSEKVARLVRSELSNFISKKILSANSPSMVTGFKKSLEELASLAKKYYVPTMISTEYPPCIKHAIDVMEKGENLPHSGRFLLGTYLLGIGKSIEQIAPLFKNAPDYNEKITMYQLNHLKGSSGSGTEYKCPSCERVKSKDLCFATSDCDGIINPIQFKKKKILNA